MDDTEQESDVFWPLYREYRGDIDKVVDRQVDLILDLAKDYETLSDDKALAMMEDYLEIRMEILDIRLDYMKKFNKILPGKKVARFYQIENKLTAVIDYDLADEIPLVQ